ncbi:DUF6792 domain-containing protein [Bacillus sp. FSL W7-1360]
MAGKDPQVFDTDVMRNRLMQDEYKTLTADMVKKIYIEGKGEPLPDSTTIKVYTSKEHGDLPKGNNYSGFDGAVVHIYDEEKGINETYTIARGSEMGEEGDGQPRDWMQNLLGTGTGKVDHQSKDLADFEEGMLEVIEKEIADKGIETELKKYGLGHSLGGGLMTKHQLANAHYDTVYTTNPAPVNVHEMVYIDEEFSLAVATKFGIDPQNDEELYSLNRKELAKFGEQYYRDKMDESSIQHLSMQEDVLYGILPLPGMMDFGNRHVIDSMSGYGGLQSLVSHLPEGIVRELQTYLAPMADAYNKGGFDGAVEELIGLDLGLIQSFSKMTDSWGNFWEGMNMDSVNNFFGGTREATMEFGKKLGEEFIPMLQTVPGKIQDAIKMVQFLRENAEEILGAFVQEGFLTETQKDAVIQELSMIEQTLQSMLITVGKILLNAHNPIQAALEIKNLIDQYNFLQQIFGNIGEHLAPMLEMIGQSKDAHLLDHVLATLNDPEYNANQSMIALFSSLTGKSPALTALWLVGGSLGTGLTPRLLLTKECFTVLHRIRLAAEGLLVLAFKENGHQIKVTNLDTFLLLVSVSQKFRSFFKLYAEKVLNDVSKQMLLIAQYWEKDEELARVIQAGS